MLSEKFVNGYDNLFNIRIDKNISVLYLDILYKMSKYFAKPYKHFGEDAKSGLDLSNYAIKAVLKGATGFDKSDLVPKSD